jgi:hypothetical protein
VQEQVELVSCAMCGLAVERHDAQFRIELLADELVEPLALSKIALRRIINNEQRLALPAKTIRRENIDDFGQIAG